MKRTTTIELSDADARLFRQFREHQDDFEILLREGFFDFRAGKAIVHRASQGEIRKIEITAVVFNANRRG